MVKMKIKLFKLIQTNHGHAYESDYQITIAFENFQKDINKFLETIKTGNIEIETTITAANDSSNITLVTIKYFDN